MRAAVSALLKSSITSAKAWHVSIDKNNKRRLQTVLPADILIWIVLPQLLVFIVEAYKREDEIRNYGLLYQASLECHPITYESNADEWLNDLPGFGHLDAANITLKYTKV
jgi:hypothetical protein